MDDKIKSAAEGDRQAILSLSQSIKESGMSQETVYQAVEAVRKAAQKDIRTSFALNSAVSSFIRSAVDICLSKSLTTSERVKIAVLDLIGDAFLNPHYLNWSSSESCPVFKLLTESTLSTRQDGLLCDAALRAINAIVCTGNNIDNKRLLVPSLLEVVKECDRGADCQLALSALESLFEDVQIEAKLVCEALRVFFGKTEGVWGEFLIPRMLKNPSTHQCLFESGVYTEFVNRCQMDEEGQWNGQLGDAVEIVIIDYSHGSPLYDEAVKAQCSKAFAEYNVHLLLGGEGRADEDELVQRALANLVRMLEAGGPSSVKFAQQANVKQAIESAICRLALNPEIPVVDKDIRTLATSVLNRIKQDN